MDRSTFLVTARRLFAERFAPRDREARTEAVWDGPPPAGLPQGSSFERIQVVPARHYYYDRRLVDGGPVWPDFDNQTDARFMAHGRAQDRQSARGESEGTQALET